ncbi:hypothetical protein ADIARSV_3746 [Arcticibacter svalbardensis MN12-7]|uniref:Uncharacterized protein n=1 Tax=Arcticibacter svalbardensis MN12-7 TaxID=1150600 RepID=R9GN05_9SPHI|nr:hypothetical protein [Arcticibacter svalbardensis]EOR93086.1 hypothetical protein ADIARSV_3746 [Arcticibacter svalbardensis MN12-7]
MSYRTSLEQKWDFENVLSYAVQEAEERKYVEGKIDGKIEGKKETARKMKTQGVQIEKIAEFTDLSISEIEEL